MHTQEDIEMYGPEILELVEGEGTLFISEFKKTEIGQRLDGEGLLTLPNLQTIQADAQEVYGTTVVNFTQFLKSAEEMWRIGDLKREIVPVVPVDTTPRDRNGKPLSSLQLAWAEMTRFAEGSSMQEIRSRQRVDPAFDSFVKKNVSRQLQESEVGDGVTPAGAPEKKAKVSEDLLLFVKRYNATSVDRLRPRGGFVELAGAMMPYQEFLELQTRATNARLI